MDILPGNSRYQVVLLGPQASRYESRFRDLLLRRLRALSPVLPSYTMVLGANDHALLDNKCPIVAVYFGPGKVSKQDGVALLHLRTIADVIIPAVDTLEDFQNKVPPPLHGINGFPLSSDPSLSELTNLVLENLGLLRRGRKLFISYKRSESLAVAQQLRDVLDRKGYDVFLDTQSVPKGDNFQEVLWHRLADSEMMVVLDTAGFLESRWTSEELAEALAMSVSILQVIWPDVEPVPYSELCHRGFLSDRDFSGDVLTGTAVARLSKAIEAQRARSLASRHDNLVGSFCKAAERCGATPTVQPHRYVTADTKDGRQIVAIPAVGVVDAALYHEASRRFDPNDKTIVLLYDGRGLRPAWSTFLKWLDRFLPVKAVPVTKLESIFE